MWDGRERDVGNKKEKINPKAPLYTRRPLGRQFRNYSMQKEPAAAGSFCYSYIPMLFRYSMDIFAASSGVRPLLWSCSTMNQPAPASRPASMMDGTFWQP